MNFFVKKGDYELYPRGPKDIERFEAFNSRCVVTAKVRYGTELLKAYLSEKEVKEMWDQLDPRLREQFITLKGQEEERVTEESQQCSKLIEWLKKR
jgi:hypothetical protein